MKCLLITIYSLLICSTTQASWFRPSNDEITVRCDKGEQIRLKDGIILPELYSHCLIQNNSRFTADMVTFEVFGQMNGHSTKYQLHYNEYHGGYIDYYSDDTILKPHQTTEFLIEINSNDINVKNLDTIFTEVTNVKWH